MNQEAYEKLIKLAKEKQSMAKSSSLKKINAMSISMA
jgi:hypothetical protein